MHDTLVTLQGNLGGEVRMRRAGENDVAHFRVGCSPGYRDRNGEWVTRETVWYSVVAWRALARNCGDSLRRGDSVVVHGRLGTTTYVNSLGVEVTDLEVTATFVGHDLNRGRSVFTRVRKAPPEAAGAGPGPAAASAPEEVVGEVSAA
jgi:single-strand DNA-binding protein